MNAIEPLMHDDVESMLPRGFSTFVLLLTSQCATTAQLNQFFFNHRIKSRKNKRLGTRFWKGDSQIEPFLHSSAISRTARFEGHSVRIRSWLEPSWPNLHGNSRLAYHLQKTAIPSLHKPLTMLVLVARSIVHTVFLKPGRPLDLWTNDLKWMIKKRYTPSSFRIQRSDHIQNLLF